MPISRPFLNPSEAASRLGVSTKALRLYEQYGLIAPGRTASGWRSYGPADVTRAREIVTLRRLGLSLAQIGRVLGGAMHELGAALAQHQAAQEGRMRDLAATIAALRDLRARLARGDAPDAAALARIAAPASGIEVSFDLPWPWDGEGFAMRNIPPLTYITGPLGSGKTRLGQRLAEVLPGAGFLGMDRPNLDDGAAALPDPAHRMRVEGTLAWLAGDGATVSQALVALVAALEAERRGALVIDMVEQGLDHATQEALIAHLRLRPDAGRPLFLLTRSSAILDPAAVGPGEAIIFCPANHSPPIQVLPHPGAPGHEALMSCLASPAVRARSQGMIAWRPSAT